MSDHTHILPGMYFEISPVAYDKHVCAHALNAIVHLITAVHLRETVKLDAGRRRLIDHDAQQFRRMIVLETGLALPPIKVEYRAGGRVMVGWKGEGEP